MRLWIYIKSRNETLRLAVIAMVVIAPLIIWSSTHKTQISISSDFKCPNDYETVEEYVESLAKWIRKKTDANPKSTPDEIQKLRDEEIAEHKCEPSHWLSEDMTTTDKPITFNLNVMIAGIQYALSDYSKNEDTWIAHYNSTNPLFDEFDREISVFYRPPYPKDSNSVRGPVIAEDVANYFYQSSENDGAILQSPISFPDPNNSKRGIYILPMYYVGEGYGLIQVHVIKEDDLGVFAITYHKRIIGSIESVSTENRILKWLTDKKDYFIRLDKFNPSDFIQENVKNSNNTNTYKTIEDISTLNS